MRSLCRVLSIRRSAIICACLIQTCGSAAFLVAAMKVLIAIYSAAIGKIQFLNNTEINQVAPAHPGRTSIRPFISSRSKIITNNLFGVDIMEEATEIYALAPFHRACRVKTNRRTNLSPCPILISTSSPAIRSSACSVLMRPSSMPDNRKAAARREQNDTPARR